MGTVPALPIPVVIEIGYMVTDWAVIEQLLLMHVVEMSGRDPADIPAGFSKLRKHWFKMARAQLPDRTTEIDELNRRAHNRSTARNYVVHGYWKQSGPDEFTSTWITYRGGVLGHSKLITSFAQLEEQSKFVHELRTDIANFTNVVLPPTGVHSAA